MNNKLQYCIELNRVQLFHKIIKKCLVITLSGLHTFIKSYNMKQSITEKGHNLYFPTPSRTSV